MKSGPPTPPPASVPSFISASQLRLLAVTITRTARCAGVSNTACGAADAGAGARPEGRQDARRSAEEGGGWVGPPPEAPPPADRAAPGFWSRQRPIVPAAI